MVPDVRVQKEARPGKKDCHSDLLLNSRALALSCLLNKPSTHKHAEWSGKSSLTLVKEVTSRVEMASCHFPCQGDICHNLLSCFTWRGRGEAGHRKSLHPNRADPPPCHCIFVTASFYPERHLFFLRSLESIFQKR